MFSTPILLIVFNRPYLTRFGFEVIRQLRPAVLYISADGPRENVPADAAKCEEVRKIVQNVDWDCQLHTRFSDQNLGCKKGVSSALTWFFDDVESGIILEDDIVPHPTFFRYCEELLALYRNDERITSINGFNMGFFEPGYKFSYRFTRFMNMWGWATWKRSLQKVDFEMMKWPSIKNKYAYVREIVGSRRFFHDEIWIHFWINKFNEVAQGKLDTWDYQFMFSSLADGHVSISPVTNLAQNIGWGKDATHTTFESHLGRIKADAMSFPLVHPTRLSISGQYEEYIKKNWCFLTLKGTPARRILRKAKSVSRRFLSDPKPISELIPANYSDNGDWENGIFVGKDNPHFPPGRIFLVYQEKGLPTPVKINDTLTFNKAGHARVVAVATLENLLNTSFFIQVDRHLDPMDDGYPNFIYVGQVVSKGADQPQENHARISVIIPSFNSETTIERAILSIISQGYRNLDLILVDGGSRDGTLSIVKKYEDFFTHIISEPDKGQCDALNKGFRLATGDVWCYLCTDDELAPGSLAHINSVFNEYPDVDLVTGGCKRIFPDGSICFTTPLPNVLERIGYIDGIEQPSTFWRSDLHKKIGFLDEKYHFVFDADLWNRFKLTGARVFTTEKILSHYHFSTLNKTSNGGTLLALELYEIVKKYGPYKGLLAHIYLALYKHFDLYGCVDGLTECSRVRKYVYRQARRVLIKIFGQEYINSYNWNFASRQQRGLCWWT